MKSKVKVSKRLGEHIEQLEKLLSEEYGCDYNYTIHGLGNRLAGKDGRGETEPNYGDGDLPDPFAHVVIPKGYRRVRWGDVTNGQIVYLLGFNDFGDAIAYGPHAIYDVNKRRLLNEWEVVFTDRREVLLVEDSNV